MNHTAFEETGRSLQSNPIAELLRHRVIPWVTQGGAKPVVVARQQMQDLRLPPGAQHSEAPSVVSPTGPKAHPNQGERKILPHLNAST